MSTALSGCQTAAINVNQTCDIDEKLIVDLKECQRPTHDVINGDFVECIRRLRIDINLDNVKKKQALKQIRLCKQTETPAGK